MILRPFALCFLFAFLASAIPESSLQSRKKSIRIPRDHHEAHTPIYVEEESPPHSPASYTKHSIFFDEGIDDLSTDQDRSLLVPITPQKPNGDSLCPCLTLSALRQQTQSLRSLNSSTIEEEQRSASQLLGPNIDINTYGVGCAPHDIKATRCLAADCANIEPVPPDCEFASCARSFCYVDPDRCERMNRPSVVFQDRWYSYATCGHMDLFTFTERLKVLKGKTFKVAFNSNSGGWKGAYNPSGSFSVNNEWYGPIVKFVKEAALVGGFSIQRVAPPEWLRNESLRFFGKSSFDYCVYATSLGYVDFCVAAYTISDKRASVTTFFETSADPLYLITFSGGAGTSWESFSQAFTTIFQPFTTSAWLMIIVFCLPFLGFLMLFHEYGAPGSAYPDHERVLKTDRLLGKDDIIRRDIPITRHLPTSLYMSFLSFFQESYDQSVMTIGGKINLLAISSFILLVMAVYTANLAAILTQDINKDKVNSIEAAIQAGYNFCSERKVADIVMERYGVPHDKIVPDPISLGGDGKPGFNCPKCSSRNRVFEMMRVNVDDDSLYCNAAFASLEDLEVFHKFGKHCEKKEVGEVLAYQNIGIPIYDNVAEELVSLFHQLKNDGVLKEALNLAQPSSGCPATDGEGSALNVEQLTGIWVIVFSFALAGILAKLFIHNTKKRGRDVRVRNLNRLDQWGNPSSHSIVINGKVFDVDGSDVGNEDETGEDDTAEQSSDPIVVGGRETVKNLRKEDVEKKEDSIAETSLFKVGDSPSGFEISQDSIFSNENTIGTRREYWDKSR